MELVVTGVYRERKILGENSHGSSCQYGKWCWEKNAAFSFFAAGDEGLFALLAGMKGTSSKI